MSESDKIVEVCPDCGCQQVLVAFMISGEPESLCRVCLGCALTRLTAMGIDPPPASYRIPLPRKP